MDFEPTTWWAITMGLAGGVSVMMAVFSWFFWSLRSYEHRAVAMLFSAFCPVWGVWSVAHLQLILGDGQKPPWFATALATAIFLPCLYLVYALFFNGYRKKRRR